MPGAITIAVFALAVARVTRFITEDKLSEGPRGRLVDRAWRRWRPAVPVDQRPRADEPLPAYLLTCPWCVSIYVAAVAAPVCWLWGESPYAFVPALGLAFSQVTGLLLTKIGD
jgi:hypothetical protein